MRRNPLTLAFGLFLISVVTAIAGTSLNHYRDIRILQSDESGVTFEYIPEYFGLRKFAGAQRIYVDYNFYGGISVGLDQAGFPNLRHRSVVVGVPSEKGNTVEVIGSEYEEIRDASIVPVPRVTEDDSGFGGNRLYEEQEEVYSTNQFLPVSVVQMGTIAYSRSTLVANILLYPVQFNPAANVVRKYTKIIVRVNFGQPARRTTRSVEDELLSSSVLNYEVAKQWQAHGDRLQSAVGPVNSVLATGDWYRIDVKADGIYRIDARALTAAGINLSQIDPRTIKIFGNGGFELPEDLNTPRPIDLVENAILVIGEEDGRFDAGDFIVFYGRSVHGWKYDGTKKQFFHYINHYIDSNYYWLTYGGTRGKRMATLPSLNVPDAFSPRSTVGKLFLEEEKRKTRVKSGREWFGHYFDSKDNVAVIANRLDGLIPTDPIRYSFVFVSRSNAYARFRVEDSGVLLGSVQIPPVDISSIVYYEALKSDVASFQRPGNLTDNRSVVRITYEPSGSVAEGYLDWMRIFYSRNFQAVNDLLNFTSPDTTAVVQYNLGNFSSSSISVFDVTDHANVKVITNATISGGNLRFQAQQRSGSVSEYFAVGPGGYKTPITIRKMGNSNLRGFADGAEFIIITHKDFLTQAQRLRAHREQYGPNRLSTVVVNVQDIFNEFAGGLPDPTAIRDYLRYAYENWKLKPRYVLLFGDGHYDYKNITTQNKNWIPPYQTMESLFKINTYTTDDYFVQIVGTDPIVDLAIGRLPVRTPGEARIVVDKIIAYEKSSAVDPWKNRITFAADDGLTSTGDDGPIHTAQTEELAERFTPGDFEKVKIYLIEYPTVVTSAGRTKPAAAKAIVDQINQGTLLINWIGHGNPQVWAHEHVFRRETTIPQLTNKDRLTFVCAATCDFAWFDKPDEQSGAELLLVRENGGAIGTLSSARIVYSFDNAEFNNMFFSQLFVRDASRRLRRLGDAVFLTKQTHFSINDTKFGLFGDPTLRLNAPLYRAQIDSINGKPTTEVIQIQALEKVTIKGSIRKPDDSPWTDYNGKLLMTVYDSRKEVPIPEWFGFAFRIPGGLIYKGENTIRNGTFSATFVVPKDILYENNHGRIGVYFSNQATDGSGYTENILVGGTDTTAVEDREGPRISIFLDSRSFRSGDVVGEDPLLIIDYFDENGINIASGGIGHRLEARIDEQTTPIDLTSFYKGKTDTYKEGTVEYRLQGLSPGKHTIRAKAWDVYNNSSTAEVAFEVASTSTLRLVNVFNYPNPFSSSTTFTFHHNQSVPIDVEIKIYTITGRLIRVLQASGVADRFVQIPWDGRDEDGDEIGNGTYLYRVIARTFDGDKSTEAIGKLSVLK